MNKIMSPQQPKYPNSKLKKYSISAAALLATNSLAMAQINTINVPMTTNNTYGIDFDGGGNDFSISLQQNPYTTTTFTSGVTITITVDNKYIKPIAATGIGTASLMMIQGNAAFGTSGRNDVAALPAAFTLGPTMVAGAAWAAPDILYGEPVTYGNFRPGGTKYYMGFRFVKAGSTYYGWIGITLNADFVSGTLNDWYMAPANTPVKTGAVAVPPVPVPVSPFGAAAAAGLIGLYGLVRNRRKQVSVDS